MSSSNDTYDLRWRAMQNNKTKCINDKKRFEALLTLRYAGIQIVGWLTSLLLFINDTEENILEILNHCKEAKVYGIGFGIGFTISDRNRWIFNSKKMQNLWKSFISFARKIKLSITQIKYLAISMSSKIKQNLSSWAIFKCMNKFKFEINLIINIKILICTNKICKYRILHTKNRWFYVITSKKT